MTNPVWAEKYRPKTVADCILPADLKARFQAMVDQNHVDNLLLAGPPGVGKTSVAKAMLEEMECPYLIVNGSLDSNIDTLRYDIRSFATSRSLTKQGRKYVILDEADNLNPNSTQPALRNFMETYSENCGFILTCNYPAKIIEPIRTSRVAEINFRFPKKDAKTLATQFFSRAMKILDTEKVPYDRAVVAQVVQKYYPDWRKCLVELQYYAKSGAIDSGIFVNMEENNYKVLVDLLLKKDFTGMRKWVGESNDGDHEIYRKLYNIFCTDDKIKQGCIPVLIITLSKYMYQSAFVADKELNLVACLTEIMADIEAA